MNVRNDHLSVNYYFFWWWGGGARLDVWFNFSRHLTLCTYSQEEARVCSNLQFTFVFHLTFIKLEHKIHLIQVSE